MFYRGDGGLSTFSSSIKGFMVYVTLWFEKFESFTFETLTTEAQVVSGMKIKQQNVYRTWFSEREEVWNGGSFILKCLLHGGKELELDLIYDAAKKKEKKGIKFRHPFWNHVVKNYSASFL